MNKLTILIGPPGSGKSTYSKLVIEDSIDNSVVVLNKDNMRKMFFSGKEKDLDEAFIFNMTNVLLEQINGKNVVLDNTNCRMSDLKKLIDKFYAKYEIEFKFFQEFKDDAYFLEVNALRSPSKRVPVDRLNSMLQAFRHTVKEKEALIAYAKSKRESLNDIITLNNSTATYSNYQRDKNKPKAVIIDIDGTVAHMHNRSPFEWDKVYDDIPDHNIIELVNVLFSHNYYPIFVSGRSEVCRDASEEWICDYIGIFDFVLHMRKEHDFRSDSVIKKEIYDEYIRDNYDVRFVLDDRNKVVDFWRSIGLKCLQVEKGDF